MFRRLRLCFSRHPARLSWREPILLMLLPCCSIQVQRLPELATSREHPVSKEQPRNDTSAVTPLDGGAFADWSAASFGFDEPAKQIPGVMPAILNKKFQISYSSGSNWCAGCIDLFFMMSRSGGQEAGCSKKAKGRRQPQSSAWQLAAWHQGEQMQSRGSACPDACQSRCLRDDEWMRLRRCVFLADNRGLAEFAASQALLDGEDTGSDREQSSGARPAASPPSLLNKVWLQWLANFCLFALLSLRQKHMTFAALVVCHRTVYLAKGCIQHSPRCVCRVCMHGTRSAVQWRTSPPAWTLRSNR